MESALYGIYALVVFFFQQLVRKCCTPALSMKYSLSLCLSVSLFVSLPLYIYIYTMIATKPATCRIDRQPELTAMQEPAFQE